VYGWLFLYYLLTSAFCAMFCRSYLVLVHMNPALASHRCVGKIAKCVATVLEKCQQRACSVTVAVATPLGTPTALSYLYAVLHDRTSSAAAGSSFHSSAASVSSTASECDYIVKARTRPCSFYGPRRSRDAASDVAVSERAIRAALKDLLALEAPALASLQQGDSQVSPATPWMDARGKLDHHLRSLRAEIKVSGVLRSPN
jgi:hypothetical protein